MDLVRLEEISHFSYLKCKMFYVLVGKEINGK